MLVKSTVTLLLASLAVTAPVKQDFMRVSLLNKVGTDLKVLDVPLDGTPVPVTGDDHDTPVSVTQMECVGSCTHYYYCILYDRDLAPIVNLKTPESPLGKFYEVGQVTCEIEPIRTQQLEATEALATES